MNQRIRVFVSSTFALVMLLVVSVAQPAGGSTSVKPKTIGKASIARTSAAATPQTGDRVFQGCWSYFPTGPCRAIYSDAQGVYWICGQCGSGGQPNPNGCQRISQRTLQYGYWCS